MKLRVITPAQWLSILSQETIRTARDWFESNWFLVDFWKATLSWDSSIDWRISDIHDAFRDKEVTHIFSWIGWHNCIELVNYIDFELIKNNPKFICGYSDITILLNAIFEKTGIITYLGPHFSSLWIKKWNDYTSQSLLNSLNGSQRIYYVDSKEWSDDLWYIDQENRNFYNNLGLVILNPWEAVWKIIWWNLSSLNLLRWTSYLPSFSWKILLIEDARTFGEESFREFKRNLFSILNDTNASNLAWIIFGRFQLNDGSSISDVKDILRNFQFTTTIPIVYGFDSWHTTPIFTIPIWSHVNMNTYAKKIYFELL